jgi:DNA polymerase III delta subunit
MILRQFRILVEMRDLFNRNENMPSAQMAQELEVHPYVAKKSLPAMKRFSLDKLKKIYGQLLEIDIKTKTGLGEPALLLDVFVRKLG